MLLRGFLSHTGISSGAALTAGFELASRPEYEGKLIVVEDLNLGEAKTKAFLASMGALGITSGLFIDGAAVDVGFARASANVPHIDVLPAIGANVYDILKHDTLVLTRAAVSALEARVNG